MTTNWKFSCVLYAYSQFMCSLARFYLAYQSVSQRALPHTFYAWLLIFDKTSAQAYFYIANCSDAVMSVFYSPVLTRSLIFLQLQTVFIFLRYRNLERWWFIFSAMRHKLRGVRVEEYAYCVNKLRQNVGLEAWIWRQIVTSQKAHNKYNWPLYAIEWNSPHENFLHTPLYLTMPVSLEWLSLARFEYAWLH